MISESCGAHRRKFNINCLLRDCPVVKEREKYKKDAWVSHVFGAFK